MVFDFHVHPSLKAQMCHPAFRPDPWDAIFILFRDPVLLTRILKCQGINEIIDSQASLTQLIDGNVNLIGLALHPPESSMLRDRLIVTLAEQEQTRYINLERIREMASGDMYFQLLNEELESLISNQQKQDRQLKIISDFSEYDPGDRNTIHAVLTVEGAHAFMGSRKGKQEDAILGDFWQNFEKFTNDNRILSINIAHLQDNDFCNHAFGMQVFRPEPFYPSGNGITSQGFKLLKRMEEKKILLDTKHMSLFARKQLEKNRDVSSLPLVCTHAGLTGISSEERVKYIFDKGELPGGFMKVMHYKPKGYLGGTSFNACSINLYDEDIRDIILSGGLIGLSFDQRILGLPDSFMIHDNYIDELFDMEVVSPHEREFFLDADVGKISQGKHLGFEDILLEDKQDYIRYHARHFINTIFHFFVVAARFHINPALVANSICIGSDFDGLINPVDGCRDVTGFEEFKRYVVSNFKSWEDEAIHALPIRISDFISPHRLMDDIFYHNAVAFLKTHLVKKNGPGI